jgi:hypothetical protein
MTSRRPTSVYSTAAPWQTGPMVPVARTARRTPSIIPLQATGARDAGGVIGTAFSLPSYVNDDSTPPAPAVAPAATPAGTSESDCCG